VEERILFDKCPLCDCSSLIDSVTGDCTKYPTYYSELSPHINWKQCVSCSHIFTEGYYTDEVCQLIYSKTIENQQVGFDIEGQRIVSSRMIEKVLPYISTGYWLDVGFGNGSLLFTAHEYGFTPIGLDLRMDTVNTMRSIGVEAHCEDICKISLDFKCAVISMADVLEHIPYPQNALQAAHGLLSDNGVLFVSLPNMESVLWKALDLNNVNPYWNEIEHYHNFTRSRLYVLLRQFGFEPVRYGISERYRACMEVIAKKITA
jgi:2-polyprenyl-3-methyl-5-hydroxy-6-metoxy-1,4-benzoquinol methylase